MADFFEEGWEYQSGHDGWQDEGEQYVPVPFHVLFHQQLNAVARRLSGEDECLFLLPEKPNTVCVIVAAILRFN